MRISDWSSDVCSSDLYTRVARTPWEIPSQLGRAPRDRGRAAFRRRSMSKDLFGYTIPSLLRGLGVLSAYLQSIQQAVDEDRFMEGKLLKRSEEHTSELQSLMRSSYAVFCLKKTKIKSYTKTSHSHSE